MSLFKKILFGILLALLVCVIGAGIFLRDDILAVLNGLRYSSQELESQIQQNDQAIKAATNVVPDVTVRDLTEEEKQALMDGATTKEELIQSMVEPKPEIEPKPPKLDDQLPPKREQTEATQPEPPKPSVQVGDYQKQLASLIAEVYVLREEFLIKLDDLMEQAKKDYLALAPEERSGAKLTGMVSKYFATAHDLEVQCDARLKDIIARMETLLKDNEQDLSIAQSVMDTYLNEKSLKKSWYLAELKKRGI